MGNEVISTMITEPLVVKAEQLLIQAADDDQHLRFTEAREKALRVVDELGPIITPMMEYDPPQQGSLAYRAASALAYAYNRLNSLDLRRGDMVSSISWAQQGARVASWNNEINRLTQLEINLGSAHLHLRDLEISLAHFMRALELAERHSLQGLIPIINGAIGSVLEAVGDHEGSLRYSLEARRRFEALGDLAGAAGTIHNAGNIYYEMGEFDKAIEAYTQAMELNRQSGNVSWLATNLSSLGTAYGDHGHYDEALKYLNEALALHEEHDMLPDEVLLDLGMLYAKDSPLHDEVKAEECLAKAVEMRRATGNKRANAQLELAALYERQGKYKESLALVHEARTLEQDSANTSIIKQAEELKHQREMAERDRAESVARAEAAVTRRLLDTVLPGSISRRMINGEERIADSFDNVSILFADLVGFTTLSKDLPAETVIILLNHIFDRFDSIIERHGCEKVKTIGDGYMAVAGAPEPVPDHAERLARAALEMSGEIPLSDEIQKLLPPGTRITSRIGLHCGPVVCGVIGQQRLIWDVYSDAVNTASRMESTGEAGRVHISEAFATLLTSGLLPTTSTSPPGPLSSLRGGTDPTPLELERGGAVGAGVRYRGETELKGKGTMTTYWLERV